MRAEFGVNDGIHKNGVARQARVPAQRAPALEVIGFSVRPAKVENAEVAPIGFGQLTLRGSV